MADWTLLAAAATLSAPLALAAMGGYTSERSGVINIGLEGMMLASACATVLGSQAYGAVVGLAIGLLCATGLSLLHWLATQEFGVDQVVSGMSINLIAAGATNFAFGKLGGAGGGLPRLPIGFFLGFAVLLPIALALYAHFTRGGLRLLSVGADPDKAREAGVQPVRVRLAALIATGVFCGLGGAMLATDVGVFTDGMTAGRGYIALAALILGGWRPIPTLVGCIAFGFLSALRVVLQGSEQFGADIPSQAWASLPYVATILALALALGKNRTPAGLGKP